MGKLLDFLYRNRITVYFLALQVICVILIFSFNSYYSSSFFNTSNAVSGSILSLSENSSDYTDLRTINKRLAEENAYLRKQLAEAIRNKSNIDLKKASYEVATGKIVNKTFRLSRNFLTLNIGENDGVNVGMGVVGDKGVVGRVHSVSKNYSTVASILNVSTLISSQVKRTGTLCTAQWLDKDFTTTSIRYIPRHTSLIVGDTIITSGYNSVYPPGVIIGVVKEVELKDESPFYEATAALTIDFPSLEYAYVIKNGSKTEIDSLELITVEQL